MCDGDGVLFLAILSPSLLVPTVYEGCFFVVLRTSLLAEDPGMVDVGRMRCVLSACFPSNTDHHGFAAVYFFSGGGWLVVVLREVKAYQGVKFHLPRAAFLRAHFGVR